MKLSNIAVIFTIITIPVILLLSYYISLQTDTIRMQSSYTAKQLNATREAIEAFEINTVEWNDDFASVGDTKRRNIMASINTFTTSFANGLGIGGASKSEILAYIPAIACTLYDGYYIYSPAETKQIIKDEDGKAVYMTEKLAKEINYSNYKKENDEGKLLYEAQRNSKGAYTYDDGSSKDFTLNPDDAKTTYAHILKPFSTYSARYKADDIDITVNYTLDNYISIYGMVDGKYVEKSGYLVSGIYTTEEKILTEKIWYEGLDNEEEFTYVYAEDNTKVYFDDKDDKTFQVSSTGIRTNLDDITDIKYKKIVNSNGSIDYQALNKEVKGHRYKEKGNEEGSYDWSTYLKKDYSAVNYYRESKEFTDWVQYKLGNIKVENIELVFDDSISEEEKQKIKKQYERDEKIFDLNNNDNNPENPDSIFVEHKNEIIKQCLISNLNQAITSYSRHNTEGEYQLPILTETDWDLVLNNVSIISFVQNIPIGLKYYNNYAIATSSSNNEYVNPDEIYLSNTPKLDGYYHMPYCSKLEYNDGVIGYRNTDYVIRTYETKDSSGVKTTNYYYKHEEIADQKCYYCLIQRNLYSENKSTQKITAYKTALARERYVSHKFLDKEYNI